MKKTTIITLSSQKHDAKLRHYKKGSRYQVISKNSKFIVKEKNWSYVSRVIGLSCVSLLTLGLPLCIKSFRNLFDRKFKTFQIQNNQGKSAATKLEDQLTLWEESHTRNQFEESKLNIQRLIPNANLNEDIMLIMMENLDLPNLSKMNGVNKDWNQFISSNDKFKKLNVLSKLKELALTYVSNEKDQLLFEILKTQIIYDINAAKNTINLIENKKLIKESKYLIIEAEAKINLTEAKNTALSLIKKKHQDIALSLIVKEEAKINSASARLTALSISDPYLKIKAFSEIIKIDSSYLYEAKDMTKDLKDGVGFLSRLELATSDPDHDFTDALDTNLGCGGRQRYYLLHILVKKIAKYDMDQAKNTIIHILDPDYRFIAMNHIVECQAKMDVATAKETALFIGEFSPLADHMFNPRDYYRSRAFGRIVEIQVENDIEGAKETAESIEFEIYKAFAYLEIAKKEPNYFGKVKEIPLNPNNSRHKELFKYMVEFKARKDLDAAVKNLSNYAPSIRPIVIAGIAMSLRPN